MTPLTTPLLIPVWKHSTLAPSLMSWVKLFFNDRVTNLLINGSMEEIIELQQCVPKGDILSPLVFNIVVETLLLKVGYTVNLEGVFFPTGESRVESHADLFPTGESPTKRRKEAIKGTITDCYLGTSKPDNFRQSPYCQSIAFSQIVYYIQK